MNKDEYANACCEVMEILKYIPKEDYEKIPQNKIKVFEQNRNKKYKFKYNPNMALEEQNVSYGVRVIIGILFRDYWATEKQKAKILNRQKYERLRLEKIKEEKYNSNNIFKKDKKECFEYTNENLPIIASKENFIKRILKNIKKYFNSKA